VLGSGGQDDHRGLRQGGAKRSRRLDPVEPRQPVVDEDHVRLKARANVERGLAVRQRGDHAHVGRQAEHELERLTECVVVLDQDDLDRLTLHARSVSGHSAAKRRG
jgi:hypothetical protein